MEKKLCEQIMGKLPIERLKPAPAWDTTALDFFGPFKIKDEVKKRTTGEAYGLMFNCLATRAVHVDISPDYSTKKFLMALRRFVSIRGYPSKLQPVCFEAANLINERPIGRHPTSSDDELYLYPNDLLLGRSTSRVPSGLFVQTNNP